MPYMKFYKKKNSKYNNNPDIEKIRKRIYDYYNKFGKDGFLSDRLSFDNIENVIDRKISEEIENATCEYSIDFITIDEKEEQSKIKTKETEEDFITWIE